MTLFDQILETNSDYYFIIETLRVILLPVVFYFHPLNCPLNIKKTQVE